MKDNKMDNQQERLLFDIGYIIGMLDGEGSYQLGCKYVRSDRHYYSPKVSIFNNNPKIIQQVINALKYIGISYHVWSPQIKGKEKRIVYRIQIAGIRRVKKFTDLILEYPSGKKERAKLLNDFCNYRLSIPQKDLDSGHIITYSQVEEDFHAKLKELNLATRGAISSETIRFTV